MPDLGTPDQLSEVVRTREVRRVLVAMSDQRGKMPMDQLSHQVAVCASTRRGGDLRETHRQIALESLRVSWLLFSSGLQTSRWATAWKTTFSFLISLFLLILCLPVMLLVALAIRLDSPGPAVFLQKRIGKGGKNFTLYKFRSMYHAIDECKNHPPAEEDDPRITGWGGSCERAGG